MIPLVKLKKDVQFNQEFTQVVDVMKGIAISRFYALQKQLSLFSDYGEAVKAILAQLDMSRIKHPFVTAKSPITGVLMVTTDAGFLGGLNSQVIHGGLVEGGESTRLVVVGERGVGYLRGLRGDCEVFPGITEDNAFGLAMEVRDHLVQLALSGQIGRLLVVYPHPVSFSVQRVVAETLLPCSEWSKHEAPSHGIPVWWESSKADTVEFLVNRWMGYRLSQIFSLSKLAEFGARAMHLEGSYQELIRRGKKLRHEYQRARHELIDRSMREIFSAQILSRRLEEAAKAAEALDDEAGGDETGA